MPILTQQEAADLLDYTSPDEMPAKVMNVLVPAIEQFLMDATGKDWGTVTETYMAIDSTARMAAGVLLVRWFEDPGMLGVAQGGTKVNDAGILSLIGQLEAKALQEKQAAEEAVL